MHAVLRMHACVCGKFTGMTLAEVMFLGMRLVTCCGYWSCFGMLLVPKYVPHSSQEVGNYAGGRIKYTPLLYRRHFAKSLLYLGIHAFRDRTPTL
jgi:hypothetical protein